MSRSGTGDGGHPELVDIYADFNQNNGEEGDFMASAETSDLYDAVVTGSVEQRMRSGGPPMNPMGDQGKQTIPKIMGTGNFSGTMGKRHSVCVGNFAWWTTDNDLIDMSRKIGVRDVVEVKFAENRANGQSRGYAEIVVSTEASAKKLLDTLPRYQINGEKLECRFATRQSFAMFEAVANKRIPQRSNSESAKDSRPPMPAPSGPSTPTAPMVLPPPPLNTHDTKLPPPNMPFFGRPPLYPPVPPPGPPPGITGPPPPPHQPPLLLPPPIPPPLFPPPPPHVPNHPPPALHLNPAFLPPPQENYGNKPSYSQHSRDREDSTPPLPDSEYDELMNRNQTIASSAISKAVAGAATGEVSLAIETLLTAIAVIKQSRVYNDDRCRALVTSLKDCLFSIESKSYASRKRHRSREKDHSRDRDRDHRERDRDHRERDRDRGRERERDRDRERDRNWEWEREREREGSYGQSQHWEAAGMSRHYRERSLSAERERERMRMQPDRHRDHRDRHR